MSKFGVLTLVFVLAVAGMVFFGLRGVHATRCEVCITFNGRTECRTGQGRDRQHAIDSARTAACAVLAIGREENIKCTSSEPTQLSCE
jgi:hypothetical protein